MSFKGNDMLLRVLAEALNKKEKLEEKDLPVKISGLATNTNLKNIGSAVHKIIINTARDRQTNIRMLYNVRKGGFDTE